MPSKGRFPHSKVQISSVDTFDLGTALPFQIIENSAEIIHIPDTLTFVVEGSANI